jgi:hypothetical protein
MTRIHRLVFLGVAAALATSAGAVTPPGPPVPPTPIDPKGTYAGTVKCEGVADQPVTTDFKSTDHVTVTIAAGNVAAVCGRWGNSAALPYKGAYFPNKDGSRGTYGFATASGPAGDGTIAGINYVETGQADVGAAHGEGKHHQPAVVGGIVLNGDSIVLSGHDLVKVVGQEPYSLTCEWKLTKAPAGTAPCQ